MVIKYKINQLSVVAITQWAILARCQLSVTEIVYSTETKDSWRTCSFHDSFAKEPFTKSCILNFAPRLRLNKKIPSRHHHLRKTHTSVKSIAHRASHLVIILYWRQSFAKKCKFKRQFMLYRGGGRSKTSRKVCHRNPELNNDAANIQQHQVEVI